MSETLERVTYVRTKPWGEVTEAEKRAGKRRWRAAEGASDRAWLKRHLERFDTPRCPTALQIDTGEWYPCGTIPLTGEVFCWRHGGAKRPRVEIRVLLLRRIISARERADPYNERVRMLEAIYRATYGEVPG